MHIMSTKRSLRRLGGIEREILEELSVSDILFGSIFSGRSTKRMFRLARERAAYRYRRKIAFQRLIKHGCVRSSGEHITITEKGLNLIDNSIEKHRGLLKSKAWDGKWRIVSYDIPERHKDIRDAVRDILKRAGFQQLQHSLWIFPHDSKELVALIQRQTKLKKHILYGLLENIEGDDRLRKMFSI